MKRDRYLQLLASDGALLSQAARRDLDAAVPSCPGWTVHDAVLHTAEVYEHKIAAIALGGTRPDPWPPQWPTDRDPLDWFEDVHGRVLEVLGSTDPEAPSWTWWPADQTAGFWVRRMAQETAVHRVDVELAHGTPTPIDPELAVDGIDELLDLMLGGDWSDAPEPELVGTAGLATAGRAWTVRMHADRVDISDGADADAAASIAADPSSLLLWLYGRAGDDVVQVTGDSATAARLRQRLALATQ